MLIKVLIIDQSAVVRQSLTEILDNDPQIWVVGPAAGPNIALGKIKKSEPDLIILNHDMPNMNSATFFLAIREKLGLSLSVLLSFVGTTPSFSSKALGVDAVGVIALPKHKVRDHLYARATEFIDKVKEVALSGPQVIPVDKSSDPAPKVSESMHAPAIEDMIIAIGASTGGTEAIREVICALPANTPPIVITQHIPMTFSKPFSERLDANSAVNVIQAEHGDPILPGHAYLAPGNRHLEIAREDNHYICQLRDTPPVNRHKPSVEVMFQSVAKQVADNALAILLTGMGDDGADAMGELQKIGAHTIAQDEESSVVWGMPGEAVKRGFADEILPLNRIAERLLYYVSKHR